MTKLVLFNGPPNSGKDTAADYVNGLYADSKHLRMKDSLYTLTSMLYHIPYVDYYLLATDRLLKDAPVVGHPSKLSPRQMLINVSENVVKPSFGKDWFGKSVANRIKQSEEDMIVMSDCGFSEEVETLINDCELSVDDVLLFRIHRENCTFEGDSRNYVYLDSKYTQIDLDNNSTIPYFFSEVNKHIMEKFH